MKAEGINIGEVAGKLDHIQILTCEKATLIPKIKKEVEYIHPRNGYEELMRVNSEGDKTTIYLKKDKNGKKEFVLLNDEKNEFTVVVITGNLTLQEIQGVMQRNSAFGAIDYLIGEVKCIFSESLRWNDLLLLLKIECFSFLARKEKHSNKQNKQIFYKTFLKYRFIRR